MTGQQPTKLSFAQAEDRCQQYFLQMPQCYHLCTPENFQIIFTSSEEFKAGMNILAICARFFPEVRIITFQLMSNHVHILASGDSERIKELFMMFRKLLHAYYLGNGRVMNLDAWNPNMFAINDIDYMRNTIVYINRNGYVISDDYTPFTYPWGANSYYFASKDISQHYEWSKSSLKSPVIRSLTHSKKFDHMDDLYAVDGIVSPLCFCHIDEGEHLFRNASHYFSKISRNVESSSAIAKIISESIYYTDDELYSTMLSLAKDQFGTFKIGTLTTDSKLSLAKKLHYDFNANTKQLTRMLKLPENVLASMFHN